jgi:hypothetical protein
MNWDVEIDWVHKYIHIYIPRGDQVKRNQCDGVTAADESSLQSQLGLAGRRLYVTIESPGNGSHFLTTADDNELQKGGCQRGETGISL